MTTCPVRGLMRRLASRDALANPHPIFAALREAGPLHDAPGIGPVLTRHDDVRAILFDRSLKVSSKAAKPGSARAGIADNLPEDLATLPAPLFLQDDPDHKRLRKLIAPRFTQNAVAALRPSIAALASKLVDDIQRKPEADLIEAFAVALPSRVIARILGIGAERLQDLRQWSEAVVHELRPQASAREHACAIEAHRLLIAFFSREVYARKARPRDDFISGLLDGVARGEASEEEVVSLCVNLLVAGHFTTTDLIGSLAYLLLTHSDERRKLINAPELWPQAVEEALRYEPPTPSLARVFGCPAAMHGRAFETGDSINVFIPSANRDPRLFEQPERFDVSREDNPHLSFGGGAHFCLGASLARAEAQIGARILFERLPRMRLASEGAAWRDMPNFRGLEKLIVTGVQAPAVASVARAAALV